MGKDKQAASDQFYWIGPPICRRAPKIVYKKSQDAGIDQLTVLQYSLIMEWIIHWKYSLKPNVKKLLHYWNETTDKIEVMEKNPEIQRHNTYIHEKVRETTYADSSDKSDTLSVKSIISIICVSWATQVATG